MLPKATRWFDRRAGTALAAAMLALLGGTPLRAGQDPFAPTSDSGLGAASSHPGALVAAGQDVLPPRAPGAPDVQVLVLGGQGSEDQVNLTYPALVPHAQAQRDADALTREASWPQHHLSVTDSALPLSGYKTPAMTSMTFSAPGVIRVADGHFQLEPIILALRSYPKIAVTFIAPPQFGFNGLRRYADAHVKIALRQMGSAYMYTIQVQDPQFTRLNLPLWQADPAAVRSAAAPPPHRSLGTLRLVSLVVITICAAAAGYGVYAWLARLQ